MNTSTERYHASFQQPWFIWLSDSRQNLEQDLREMGFVTVGSSYPQLIHSTQATWWQHRLDQPSQPKKLYRDVRHYSVLRGIVVALDVNDFLTATPESIKLLAAQYRQAILVILKTLNYKIPVQILWLHADTIPGLQMFWMEQFPLVASAPNHHFQSTIFTQGLSTLKPSLQTKEKLAFLQSHEEWQRIQHAFEIFRTGLNTLNPYQAPVEVAGYFIKNRETYRDLLQHCPPVIATRSLKSLGVLVFISTLLFLSMFIAFITEHRSLSMLRHANQHVYLDFEYYRTEKTRIPGIPRWGFRRFATVIRKYHPKNPVNFLEITPRTRPLQALLNDPSSAFYSTQELPDIYTQLGWHYAQDQLPNSQRAEFQEQYQKAWMQFIRSWRWDSTKGLHAFSKIFAMLTIHLKPVFGDDELAWMLNRTKLESLRRLLLNVEKISTLAEWNAAKQQLSTWISSQTQNPGLQSALIDWLSYSFQPKQQTLFQLDQQALQQRWETTLFADYQQHLYPWFPLNPSGSPVAIEDWIDFYSPQHGKLSQFQNQELTPFIQKWSAQGIEVVARALPAWNLSALKGELLIKPVPEIQEIVLKMHRNVARYHNQPEEWLGFTWSLTDPLSRLQLRVVDNENREVLKQEFEGPFSIWQWLASATTQERDEDLIWYQWKLPKHRQPLKIGVKAAWLTHPWVIPKQIIQ